MALKSAVNPGNVAPAIAQAYNGGSQTIYDYAFSTLFSGGSVGVITPGTPFLDYAGGVFKPGAAARVAIELSAYFNTTAPYPPLISPQGVPGSGTFVLAYREFVRVWSELEIPWQNWPGPGPAPDSLWFPKHQADTFGDVVTLECNPQFFIDDLTDPSNPTAYISFCEFTIPGSDDRLPHNPSQRVTEIAWFGTQLYYTDGDDTLYIYAQGWDGDGPGAIPYWFSPGDNRYAGGGVEHYPNWQAFDGSDNWYTNKTTTSVIKGVTTIGPNGLCDYGGYPDQYAPPPGFKLQNQSSTTRVWFRAPNDTITIQLDTTADSIAENIRDTIFPTPDQVYEFDWPQVVFYGYGSIDAITAQVHGTPLATVDFTVVPPVFPNQGYGTITQVNTVSWQPEDYQVLSVFNDGSIGFSVVSVGDPSTADPIVADGIVAQIGCPSSTFPISMPIDSPVGTNISFALLASI